MTRDAAPSMVSPRPFALPRRRPRGLLLLRAKRHAPIAASQRIAPLTLIPQGAHAPTSDKQSTGPAVLVEDSPSSSQQNQKLAFGGAPDPSTSPADPIIDDSQPLPFSTPDSIAAADSASGTGPLAPARGQTQRYSAAKRFEEPPASYVPQGDAKVKGKGKAVERVKDRPAGQVRRAPRLPACRAHESHSPAQQPAPMDVDLAPAPSPQSSTSRAGLKKRRSMAELQVNSEHNAVTGGVPARKKQKVSEASEIEV